MRHGSTLSYLFADQLGSTSVVANSSGSKTAEVRYKAWGEDRYTSGTVPSGYRFTGQRIEATLGLYYYGARWYDASLGRFLSADTIVPNMGDPQAWDRYAYVNNNPVVFVDPTGHMADRGGGASSMGDKWWENRQKKLDFLNKKEKSDKPSFIPLNTATPTGPTYNPAPSATPDTILDHNGNTEGEGINIRIQVNVDWSKVDKVDAIIDTGGVIGDVALFFQPEGNGPYIISEAAEGLGFIKGLSDIGTGDTSNMFMHQFTNTFEKAPVLFFRFERLAPGIGSVGNLVSLYLNLKPKLSISIEP
jgi:RHS repeat-associated protein